MWYGSWKRWSSVFGNALHFYVCLTSLYYFQVAFQLHVLVQNVAYDDLTRGIFLGAFGNVWYNNIIPFRLVLKVLKLSFQMVTQGVSILLLDVSFTVSTLLANSSPCFKFLISPNKLYCFGLELVKLNAQDIMATLTVWIKLVDFHCQTLDQSGLSFKIAISWH